MANLIARIAVLLVLAAAGMVLADRKEKIDLSVSLLLFLAAVNVTSFFSLKDNRIVVVMILTVYFLLYAGAKELLRRRAEKNTFVVSFEKIPRKYFLIYRKLR